LLYIPLELKEKLQTQLNPLIDKEVSTLMQPMKMEPSPMIKDYIAMKREEGIKAGMKEGVKKGKVEGIKVGVKEVAKKMLQKNMDIETIIECTGVSKEAILHLQKKLYLLNV
jgi:predicted transposase/invertase (TIGR01784 family)